MASVLHLTRRSPWRRGQRSPQRSDAGPVLGLALCTVGLLACRFGWEATVPASPTSSSLPGTNTPIVTVPSATPGGQGTLEIPIEYDFLTPFGDLPPGEGLVVWDFKANRFDYLSWDGQRFPLLTISLPKGEDSYGPAPVFGQADKILINPIDRAEFYVFDLRSGEAWGYATGCDGRTIITSNRWAVGARYVVFRCPDDEPNVLHAVSLTDPSSPPHRLTVPASVSNPDRYSLLWTSETDIVFREGPNGSVRGWCSASLGVSAVECHAPPLWAGSISPDGSSIEVRNDFAQGVSPWSPEQVGMAAAECITQADIECEPRWYQVQGVVATWDDIQSRDFHRILAYPAAWSPDGENVVFIVRQEPLGGMDLPPPPGNDVWQLDLGSGEFTHLLRLPQLSETDIIDSPMFRWTDASGQVLPSLWAPDGEHVLIEHSSLNYVGAERGYPLYSLSIRDGSLSLLTEDGGPVIGPLSVP